LTGPAADPVRTYVRFCGIKKQSLAGDCPERFFLSVRSAIGIKEPHGGVCGLCVLILEESDESNVGYLVTTASLNLAES
jgi:hypothetical protein